MPVSNRTRLADIARDLGLSKAAVSKALRNAPDISGEIRTLVQERARQMNYQPDPAARSLATRRSYTVGLVIPELVHSFFAEIAKAVARSIHSLGYTLVLVVSEEDPELERIEVERLLARRVDGILLASSQPAGTTALLRHIRRQRTPLVLMDREVPGVPADFAGVDNVELGRLATEHLIQSGRRRIAHLCCPQISTGAGRREGYRKALRQYGMPPGGRCEIEVENSDEGGYAGATALLSGKAAADGVFCFSDPVAAGAERAFLEAGLQIPGDIALIGAGNLKYSDQLRVPLSTVDMSSSRIGERAAEFLLARMEGGRIGYQSFYAPLQLIARESSEGRYPGAVRKARSRRAITSRSHDQQKATQTRWP